MDKEWVRQNLPEAPPFEICKWAVNHTDGDLGPNYMIFKPERIPIYPERKMIESAASWKPIGKARAARCKCTICENEFYTEMAGPDPVFFIDDCGETYPLDPRDDDPEDQQCEYGYSVGAPDGSMMTCPWCGYDVQMINADRLRGGRKKQTMVISIDTVGKYAAVIYWIVYRQIYEYGSSVGFYPRNAYVINEKGGLVRYSHVRSNGYGGERNAGEWRLLQGCVDALDQTYHDWGSINNKKKGGFLYPNVAMSLDGSTGEKAGLQKFVETKCEYVLSYLKLWRKYPGLENLVNLGWDKLVAEIAMLSFGNKLFEDDLIKYIHLKARKPHEMLGMTKAEFKAIRAAGKQWDWPTQKLFAVYRQAGITDAGKFLQYLNAFSDTGIRTLCEIQRRYGDADPERMVRYLQKQKMHAREIGILLDARNMAKALAQGRELTQEELWPRNLPDVHDRLTRMRLSEVDAVKAAEYQSGFDKVRQMYGALEWSDGEFCIFLPRCNGDLIREGAILRHCVGSYGPDHIDGTHTIFFVRHARRPERCFYTLDINMIGTPFRNQLHGYGNERHGINKQYIHHIPKKVTDFVARWEKEILMKWHYQQKVSKDRRKTA